MRQKARARWIREGDCNSRYFHLLMNSRRLNTAVKGIHIEDAWTNDPTTVKEEVLRFFSNRFCEPDHSRPVLDGVRFRGISQHQNDLLVGAFIGEEIRAAVWDCGSEKSPGPDGLNFKFIKQFWEVLKPDFRRFCGSFSFGIKVIKDALLPLGNTPFAWNSSKNLLKSGFSTSKNYN